jgi:hypothetical protein
MEPMRRVGFLSLFAAVGFCTVAWTAVGNAQGRGGAAAQAPPVRVRIQVTQVKPEMVGTFQDLIKNELGPALKKAGVQYMWTFTTGPIGQGFTFVNVQPVANYAQYDQPGALGRAIGADGVANYNAKLRPTIVAQQAWVQTLNPAMSIVSNATTPPVLVVLQDFQVLPGKNAEFASIMTSDFVPAMRKAGVKDFWVYATNFGGPGGRISTARPIAKYAELDPQPGGGLLVRGGLSQEAANQVNARRAALFSSTETNVYRYVPELSFGMPAPAPGRGGQN